MICPKCKVDFDKVWDDLNQKNGMEAFSWATKHIESCETCWLLMRNRTRQHTETSAIDLWEDDYIKQESIK